MRKFPLFLAGLIIFLNSANVSALDKYQFDQLQKIETKYKRYQKYRTAGRNQPGDSNEIHEARQQIRENFARLDLAVNDIQARYGQEKMEVANEIQQEKDLVQARQKGEYIEIAELTVRKALRSFSNIFGARGMKKSLQDTACNLQINSHAQSVDMIIEDIMAEVAEIRTIRLEEKRSPGGRASH